MVTLLRTNSDNADFIDLVKQLDAYLAIIDGEEHAFYNQFNKTSFLTHVVVAYHDNEAVGCGAVKPLTPSSMEVKRMFTLPGYRGQKIATQILQELENWTNKLGYEICRLETGIRQPEAIALYEKCGYHRIPNYGQYTGINNSACFEKKLV